VAKLFLSYSRKNSSRAERLSQWLERQGHDVWRDEDDIGGGASFSSEIEKALNDCDAVLVLWSADSVQSAWVRDEAGIGRDAGKLIPLSLDGTEPPLGFRQFQSIDLSKWKGHGAPSDAERITHSIQRVAARPAPDQALARAPSVRWPLGRKGVLAGAVAPFAVIAVLGLFFWRGSRDGRHITIAVVASPSSPDRAAAANYADITAADMASFLPVHSDKASVIPPGTSRNGAHDYVMQIAAGRQGKGADASVTLTDGSGTDVLWSKSWSVTESSQTDMRQPISSAASHAALCLVEGRTGVQRLEERALANFVNGCAIFDDPDRSPADIENAFSRVIEAAPNFAPAWAYLAVQRSFNSGQQSSADGRQDAALKARAQQAIARTLQLDPRNGKAYLAQVFLIWPHDNFRGLALINKAAALAPDDAFIQATLSGSLRLVGRLADAVDAAERAAELDPFSEYVEVTYIAALQEDGQFDREQSEIGKVRNVWRNTKIADFQQFNYDMAHGDLRGAQNLLPSLDVGQWEGPMSSLIAARMQPTPANIDAALTAYGSRSAKSPAAKIQYVAVLAQFGKTDDAFQLLSDKEVQQALSWDLLFGARLASLRKDPRFMKLAAQLGLVRYWRSSDKWPDFCTSEQLTYDCKVEAAKYAS
jgi:tetratricopeptide (TPR) repeat protein